MLLKTPEELLYKLASSGGVVVGTNKLTELGIAEARAQGRMFVTEAGLGFVVLPNDVPHPTATLRALQQLEAAKQRELELLAVLEKKQVALQAMVDSCSEHHCGLKIADDALNTEPSQALREHEATVLAENDNAVSSVLVDADHLAHCAERLLAALNKVAGAKERVEVDDTAMAHGELQEAEELVREYWRAVRSAAYEYRKRAERLRRMAEERRKK